MLCIILYKADFCEQPAWAAQNMPEFDMILTLSPDLRCRAGRKCSYMFRQIRDFGLEILDVNTPCLTCM